MPLANQRGVVTLAFEKLGDGRALVLNQWRRVSIVSTTLECRSPVIPARHYTITSRCTQSRTRMGICKRHSSGRNSIDIGRLPSSVFIEGGNIPNSQIIRQDNDNIRPILSLSKGLVLSCQRH